MDALLAAARRRAEDWLTLVPYAPASAPGAPALAVLSYPQADTTLRHRTYIYAQALALLWFSWTGQSERAHALARTLYYLQQDDGSWGYSFDTRPAGDYHRRYVRSGTVAWAATGLAYFATQFAEPQASLSARRATRFLQSARLGGQGPSRGLVSAGKGLPTTLPDAPPSALIDFAPAEHQFDTQPVLALFDPLAARRLAERMLDALWLQDEGRFALAARADDLDTRRALDAAGAWGALWLWAHGQPARARRSFDYARQTFATTARIALDDPTRMALDSPARAARRNTTPGTVKSVTIQGFRPYQDDVDDYDIHAATDHIFVEGSMSMGLAAHRLGEEATARQMLRTGISLSCAGAPGVAYSNVPLPGFTTHAAAAPTLWFLFLAREMVSGQTAPIFQLQPTPASSPGFAQKP